MVTESAKKASNRYKKTHLKELRVWLHRDYDADIIAKLDRQGAGNKTAYIKGLIRADIEKKSKKI